MQALSMRIIIIMWCSSFSRKASPKCVSEKRERERERHGSLKGYDDDDDDYYDEMMMMMKEKNEETDDVMLVVRIYSHTDTDTSARALSTSFDISVRDEGGEKLVIPGSMRCRGCAIAHSHTAPEARRGVFYYFHVTNAKLDVDSFFSCSFIYFLIIFCMCIIIIHVTITTNNHTSRYNKQHLFIL